MRVLTPAQMREAERRTIDDHGVPSLHLMERAGEEVVAAVEAYVTSRPGAATMLCGRGNNGGDGWVVARLLRRRGWHVDGLLFARVDDVAGDARTNLDRAREAGVPVTEVLDADGWDPCRPRLDAGGLVVDAIVGTGLKRLWPVYWPRSRTTSTPQAVRSSRSISRPGCSAIGPARWDRASGRR